MWSSDKFSLGLLKDHKVIFTNPKLTNKVTYSDPKVTYIDPTHLLLPIPTLAHPFPELYNRQVKSKYGQNLTK